MSSVAVEVSSDESEAEEVKVEEAPAAEEPQNRRRPRGVPVEVEIEREVTKRQLIESVTQIVVVILYMVFTLLRERDAGVVVLDPDEGPEDDWQE